MENFISSRIEEFELFKLLKEERLLIQRQEDLKQKAGEYERSQQLMLEREFRIKKYYF